MKKSHLLSLGAAVVITEKNFDHFQPTGRNDITTCSDLPGKDLVEGAQLLFNHFATFRLEICISELEIKNQRQNSCTFLWTKNNQQTLETFRFSSDLSPLQKVSNTLDLSS
jgi:hypothetical protein